VCYSKNSKIQSNNHCIYNFAGTSTGRTHLKNLELIGKIGQGQIITYQVLTNSQTQSGPTIFSSMRSADLCVSFKQQWQRCLCNHSQTHTYLAQHAPQVKNRVIIIDSVCKTPDGNHRVKGELFPLPTKYHDPSWGFTLY
jgi:hypothetical protein